MMPFWAKFHYHQPIQFKPPKAPSNMRSEILADATVSRMDETHWLFQQCLLEAQVWHSKYAAGKNVTFEVSNKVWLSTRHIRTTRPSNKLDYKWPGPYTVSMITDKNSYKLELLKPL
jgi:hypothetical protein